MALQSKIGYAIGLTLRNIPAFKRWIGARQEPNNWRNAGVRGLPIEFDFSLGSDFTGSIPIGHDTANVAGLEGIQSVYVDNKDNIQPCVLTILNSPVKQAIIIPAFSQGTYALFTGGSTIDFDMTTQGTVKVRTLWLNTDLQYNVWNASVPVSGTIIVQGTVISQPVQGQWTDRSVTIGALGSQPLMGVNAARKGTLIRNPATATAQGLAAPEPAYINWTAAAAVNGATSYELLPGESLPPLLCCSIEAINVAVATIGHILIAKEM